MEKLKRLSLLFHFNLLSAKSMRYEVDEGIPYKGAHRQTHKQLQ